MSDRSASEADDPMRVLTVREVAALLRLSVSSVRRLNLPSTLAPDAHGERRRVRGYRLGEVQAWFEAYRVTSPPGITELGNR